MNEKIQEKSGLLSVVVPAYNESANIADTAVTISEILQAAAIPFELLFIDDGSKDQTWAEIETIKSERIRGIRFSRNFGKEAAIFAGLAQAAGDCVAVIDCDLQHPPEKLIEMYRLWQQGYQVIEGIKSDRGKESPLYTASAKLFYSAISKASGTDMSRASDFKLLDRKAVDTLLAVQEKNTFFRALSFWIGFKTAQVEYEVQPRRKGKTKWSLFGLIRYSFSSLSAFSTAPLNMITLMGAIFMIGTLLLGAHSLWMKLSGRALEGFTTVILLILLVGSLLMISLGIIGYYLARIYEELKDRPRYVIAEDTKE